MPSVLTPNAKAETALRNGVRTYCRKNAIDGIVVGKIAAGGAMMVFASSDGLS